MESLAPLMIGADNVPVMEMHIFWPIQGGLGEIVQPVTVIWVGPKAQFDMVWPCARPAKARAERVKDVSFMVRARSPATESGWKKRWSMDGCSGSIGLRKFLESIYITAES